MFDLKLSHFELYQYIILHEVVLANQLISQCNSCCTQEKAEETLVRFASAKLKVCG